jgi:hypothetical protein
MLADRFFHILPTLYPATIAFMMASGYDTMQYLLDRANIHDTATRMVCQTLPIHGP